MNRIKNFSPNPLYREYEQAIRLAQLILKRYSYAIDQTETEQITTPPFWIDMSRLFELYVYKKLRDIFPGKGEVVYHFRAHGQEPDFLVNSVDESGNDLKLIVDAKYKTYGDDDRSVELADIRQLSGYARLRKVYEKLGMATRMNETIDCVILYACREPSFRFCLCKSQLRDEPLRGYTHFFLYFAGLFT